jgi:7-cyano-7-deazaguanine synthase
MTKSVILLSGGLDSLVSLGLTKEKLNVTLALTFDYGQKSAQKEIDKAEEMTRAENERAKLDAEKISK